MSSTQTPQGIIAIVRKPEWSLDDIGGKTIMILEDIQDPGNLGTIIRTGEGAGIGGIIVTRGTADITNPKTVRSTMGSIFRVPFVVTDDLHETIRLFRQRGFSIYAAALEGSIPYDEPDYTRPSAFLVGNEGNGLTAAARAEADKAVRIPMGGKVESLNAAIASAILMYEARRQNKSFDGVS
jgi:TrmH family RNA methyltransferase